ncbi:hypothetical protein LMG3458_03651 [Achromobacter deleyi]|uniref:Uncharacterized protein n=1 Tax=Achromobacter deleyi TaxID=1353891 RepID=A0A6S7A779_9BURK|nr:hypothetical protein LMG3458_03651 [Achromobacter deleyi]CAB3845450.1 hypothetical protein LMG3481_01479 [Achromobacter deleyi]CAB3852511.1 hypothetical protein LMG3482_01842 [Achromobacter deleyi]
MPGLIPLTDIPASWPRPRGIRPTDSKEPS